MQHTFHLLPLDAAVSQDLERGPSHGGDLLLFSLLLAGRGFSLTAQTAQAVQQLDEATANQTLLLTPIRTQIQSEGEEQGLSKAD